MWFALIQPFVPLMIKLIVDYLAKKEDMKKAREAFLKFVEIMQSHPSASVSLKTSYQAQLDRLKDPPVE